MQRKVANMNLIVRLTFGNALNILTDISKISFLFPYDLVENKQGHSVRGYYNALQLFSLLRRDSHFEGEPSNNKAFLIKPLTIKKVNNNSLRNE